MENHIYNEKPLNDYVTAKNFLDMLLREKVKGTVSVHPETKGDIYPLYTCEYKNGKIISGTIPEHILNCKIKDITTSILGSNRVNYDLKVEDEQSDTSEKNGDRKTMKVIKHGKKEFIGVCSRCGCVFRYTIEDLKARVSINNGEVNCPDCGKTFYHKDQSVENKLVMEDRPGMAPVWVTTSTDLPMTEIRLSAKDAKSNIEYVNDNYSNGPASDAIFWS